MVRHSEELITTFLLGAGVSRAASSEMPLVDDLGRAVLEALDRDGRLSEVDLRAVRLGMRRGLETYLTQLSERQPHHDAIDQAQAYLRKVAIMDQIAGVVAQCQLRAESGGRLASMAALVDMMCIQPSRVLTLNYDTLVETHFDPAAAGVAAALAGSTLPLSMAKAGHLVVGYRQAQGGVAYLDEWTWATMRLFKLHGSINWFMHDADQVGESFMGVPPSPVGEAEGPTGAWDVAGRQPVIVAPTSQKSLSLGNAKMRDIWRLARRDAGVADRLVVIGYSFPVTDTAVASLVADAFAERPTETVVVDRSAPGVAERLGRIGIDVDSIYDGEDAIERFVSDEIDRVASTRLQRAVLDGIPDSTVLLVGRDAVHAVGVEGDDVVLSIHTDECCAGDGLAFDLNKNIALGAVRDELVRAARVWVDNGGSGGVSRRRRVVGLALAELGPGELRLNILTIR